ncbi:hypothetical protein B0J17DRAFT_385391 [Rhizoctonia solani]|nr:hypothetical protein B0J17DRAFT_385391 [Rhizoctonia solani]
MYIRPRAPFFSLVVVKALNNHNTSVTERCELSSYENVIVRLIILNDHRIATQAKPTDIMSPTPKARKQTLDALNTIVIAAQTIPRRLQKLRITSKSTSRALPYVYGERHKQIFPAGFDSTSSSSSTQRPFYSFTPEQLYDMLTSGYVREHHVEDITVKSASYCKKNTAPKHEFIILEVEDKQSPGLKNFIALDRNNGESPTRQKGLAVISSSSQSLVAKDEFRVSYDGNKTRLLAQCDLRDHETLETLVFKPDDPLLLYQLPH